MFFRLQQFFMFLYTGNDIHRKFSNEFLQKRLI